MVVLNDEGILPQLLITPASFYINVAVRTTKKVTSHVMSFIPSNNNINKAEHISTYLHSIYI